MSAYQYTRVTEFPPMERPPFVLARIHSHRPNLFHQACGKRWRFCTCVLTDKDIPDMPSKARKHGYKGPMVMPPGYS